MPLDPIDRFEQRFRDWARRPPATPPDEAARRILHRLPAAPRPVLSWPRLAATATAAALVVALATQVYLRPPSIPPVVPSTTVGVVEAPLVPEGVALIWLESGTPLYLTLSAPVKPNGDPTP